MRLLQPTRSMGVAEFMAAVDSVCTVRPRYKRPCSPYPRLESSSTMPRDALIERQAFSEVLELATKALVLEHRLCDALRTFALFVACDSSPHEFVRCWREECPATNAGTMARAFTVLQTRYWFWFDALPAAMKPWDRIKATIHRHHSNRFGKLPTPDIFELEAIWELGKAEDAYLTDGCGCDTFALHSAVQHQSATGAGKLPAEASGAAPTKAPALTRHCTLCRNAVVARPRTNPTMALHLLLSAALSTLNDVVSAANAELQLSNCGAPSQLLVRLTCRCCVCHGYQVDARSVMCGLWLWGLRLTGVDPTGSLGMTTTSQQPQKGCNSASRRPV